MRVESFAKTIAILTNIVYTCSREGQTLPFACGLGDRRIIAYVCGRQSAQTMCQKNFSVSLSGSAYLPQQALTQCLVYICFWLQRAKTAMNAFGYNYENERKSVCLYEENYCSDFVYMSGDDYVLRLLVFVR